MLKPRARRREPLRVLAIGSHADDIEIGCGGTLLRLAAERGARGALGRPERQRGARGRGADERRGVPRRRDDVPGLGRGLPRRVLPLRRRGEGVLRDAEGARLARPRPHAPRLRPPPGPPARRRADLEHVPRPPDPRVRDPEVRRRPRLAQRLRPPGRGRRRGGRPRSCSTGSRPSGASAGSPRTCSSRSCGCAGWRPDRRAATPRRSTAERSYWAVCDRFLRVPGTHPKPRRRSNGRADPDRDEDRRGDRPRAGRSGRDREGVEARRGRRAEADARADAQRGRGDGGADDAGRREPRRQEDGDPREGPRDQAGGDRDDVDLPRLAMRTGWTVSSS